MWDWREWPTSGLDRIWHMMLEVMIDCIRGIEEQRLTPGRILVGPAAMRFWRERNHRQHALRFSQGVAPDSFYGVELVEDRLLDRTMSHGADFSSEMRFMTGREYTSRPVTAMLSGLNDPVRLAYVIRVGSTLRQRHEQVFGYAHMAQMLAQEGRAPSPRVSSVALTDDGQSLRRTQQSAAAAIRSDADQSAFLAYGRGTDRPVAPAAPRPRPRPEMTPLRIAWLT